MSRLILIDGNSILNRAFYGIMGTKMLTTADGKYTNAVYGFFSILFKVMDDLQPEYMAVAFDVKAPTARHKMYEGYKATRKGMPNELAEQMPIVKDILELMNITINGLRKYTLALPMIGISIVGTNYIQSTGRAKMAMVLSLLRQVIILIPMILILPKFLGLDGVWFAQPTADAISSILTAIVIFKEFRSYEKTEDKLEEINAI